MTRHHRSRKPYSRLVLAPVLVAVLLGSSAVVLSGCDDSPPSRRTDYTIPTPEGVDHGIEYTMLPHQTPPTPDSDIPDYLAAGGTANPAEEPTPSSDFADTPDLIAPSAQPLTDTATPDMPTWHTYWLRGMARGGRVQAYVNGILVGSFAGPVDFGITRYCHPGANTVSFNWQPLAGGGGELQTHLELIEGEGSRPPFFNWQPSPSKDSDRHDFGGMHHDAFVFSAR